MPPSPHTHVHVHDLTKSQSDPRKNLDSLDPVSRCESSAAEDDKLLYITYCYTIILLFRYLIRKNNNNNDINGTSLSTLLSWAGRRRRTPIPRRHVITATTYAWVRELIYHCGDYHDIIFIFRPCMLNSLSWCIWKLNYVYKI